MKNRSSYAVLTRFGIIGVLLATLMHSSLRRCLAAEMFEREY